MSYKLVDQIKKSALPRPLKTVLESYASFGNKDGTSIRPTEAAVGGRASVSRYAVCRSTKPLVAAGLLVHDLDEQGRWLTHAYADGVWAYIYHIDASKLSDPDLIVQWETQRAELIEKRRAAGAKNTKTRWPKGVSGNPFGQSKLPQIAEQNVTLRAEQIATKGAEQIATPRAEQIATRTIPGVPDPADHSAPNGAVNKRKKEGRKATFAPLTTPSKSEEQEEKPRSPFNPVPHWVAPLPVDKPATEEELDKGGDMYALWQKGGFGFMEGADPTNHWSDNNAAVRVLRAYGDDALDDLRDTFLCPKTAKYRWKDFSYWCEHYVDTHATLCAWRNTVEAQKLAKASAWR